MLMTMMMSLSFNWKCVVKSLFFLRLILFFRISRSRPILNRQINATPNERASKIGSRLLLSNAGNKRRERERERARESYRLKTGMDEAEEEEDGQSARLWLWSSLFRSQFYLTIMKSLLRERARFHVKVEPGRLKWRGHRWAGTIVFALKRSGRKICTDPRVVLSPLLRLRLLLLHNSSLPRLLQAFAPSAGSLGPNYEHTKLTCNHHHHHHHQHN